MINRRFINLLQVQKKITALYDWNELVKWLSLDILEYLDKIKKIMFSVNDTIQSGYELCQEI